MLRRGSKEVDAPIPASVPLTRPGIGPVGPVEVSVAVRLPADQLLLWFLDPERWVRFQGRQAWIDPVPQGRIRIEMAPGVYTAGTFLAVDDHRVCFTWGREHDHAMPAGSTTVTITVTATGPGTSRVDLVHEGLPDRGLAEEHRGGWRYHLVRLAVAAGGASGDDELVDLFLAATAEPDPIARRGLLERTCSADVHVADGNDDTYGVTPLAAKLGRLVAEAPGLALVRVGAAERVGAILRCPYALRREPDLELERGQLVATLDRNHHLAAVSLFA